MKAVIIIACLVGIGLGTYVLLILINGARDRIARINEKKRRDRGL